MISVKCLSAGLLAIAMLSTSATAQAMTISARHEMERSGVSASPFGQWTESNVRMPAPFADGANESSLHASGGVCDVGDDPMIC